MTEEGGGGQGKGGFQMVTKLKNAQNHKSSTKIGADKFYSKLSLIKECAYVLRKHKSLSLKHKQTLRRELKAVHKCARQ